jgi:RecA-family ATPase
MKLQTKLPSEMSSDNAGAWLVPTLVPENSLTILSAIPKLGKTQLAMELGLAVALGEPALHKYQPTRKGTVLLCLLEDVEAEARKRLESISLSHFHTIEQIKKLHVLTGMELRLNCVEGRAALEEAVERIKPDLVVLDNYSRLTMSESLRSARELFGYLKALKDRTGCSIVVVAHEGKQNRSGGFAIRGSSEAFSWCEAHLRIFHDQANDQRMLARIFRNHGFHPDTPLHVWSSGSILTIEERFSWRHLQEKAEVISQRCEVENAEPATNLPN